MAEYNYDHEYEYKYGCCVVAGLLPCLLLLLLVVEGIFKWNPGKCAKSHHAILHTVTIPNRL